MSADAVILIMILAFLSADTVVCIMILAFLSADDVFITILAHSSTDTVVFTRA